MDSEIIGAILGPLVTAVLAIVAYIFQDWRTKRRWETDRERSVAQAIQEVQYLDLWLSALNRLGGNDPEWENKRQRALADLERSYRVMAFDLADDGPKPKNRSLTEHLGWFLLFPLQHTGAKVVRVFYLISLAAAILWVVGIIAVFDTRAESGLITEILASMIVTVMGFVPAILFAVWARHLEHRHQQRRLAPTAPAPDQPWPTGPFQLPPFGHGPRPGARPHQPNPAPPGRPGPWPPAHP